MKTIKRINIKKAFQALFLALTLFAVTAQSSYAGIGDKTSEKARAAVKNAAPDDWKTFAKSAERCIRKGVNMKEAAEWLERSLAIKKTAYNLEVQGDYYAAMDLPVKAMESYIEAIKINEEQGNFYSEDLQTKIIE